MVFRNKASYYVVTDGQTCYEQNKDSVSRKTLVALGLESRRVVFSIYYVRLAMNKMKSLLMEKLCQKWYLL